MLEQSGNGPEVTNWWCPNCGQPRSTRHECVNALDWFNPAARCPKCAESDIGAAWHPAAEFPPLSCRDHGSPCCEHIARFCRRCHYEWSERPLDSQEASGD